jgi:hypothetical protein
LELEKKFQFGRLLEKDLIKVSYLKMVSRYWEIKYLELGVVMRTKRFIVELVNHAIIVKLHLSKQVFWIKHNTYINFVIY